jgi:hypothetical protein
MPFPNPTMDIGIHDLGDRNDLTRFYPFNAPLTTTSPLNTASLDNATAYVSELPESASQAPSTSIAVSRSPTTPQLLTASRLPATPRLPTIPRFPTTSRTHTAIRTYPTFRSLVEPLTNPQPSTVSTLLNGIDESFGLVYAPFHYNGPNMEFYRHIASYPQTPPESSRNPHLLGALQTHQAIPALSPLRPLLPYHPSANSRLVHSHSAPRPYMQSSTAISGNQLFAPRHPLRVLFGHFGKLPTELRIMIWELGMTSPRLVRWGKDRPPAISQVNHEARSVFIK